jgi:hypothetical protein
MQDLLKSEIRLVYLDKIHFLNLNEETRSPADTVMLIENVQPKPYYDSKKIFCRY